MQSYLRLGAAAILFSLFMAIPVALCIILDTRMNTPPPVPLPEPPSTGKVLPVGLPGPFRMFTNSALPDLLVPTAETNWLPVLAETNPAARVIFCPFDLVSAGDDEIEFVDGPRTIRLRVIHAKCDCPVCQEYRDKYPDWESTSHYHKTHKGAMQRP